MNSGKVVQRTPFMQVANMVQEATGEQSKMMVHDDTCSVDSKTLEKCRSAKSLVIMLTPGGTVYTA